MRPLAAAEEETAARALTKATRRAAERLAISQKELAGILGVSPSTISRLSTRPLDPQSKEGELGILFVRLYRSLDALLGGDAEASREWLHAHNRHLGGVPAEMLRSVTGLVQVIEYLDAMRGKV